jgi:steroid 5-alpha reductase family enzyme
MTLHFSTLLLLCGAMFLLWLVSLVRRDASIVDIFWGAGFALVAWLPLRGTPVVAGRQLLFSLLTIVWGLRLAVYLAWRNLGRGEDPRYQAMRARYGERFWLTSLPLVFLLQGGLIWIISLPVQALGGQTGGWRLADLLGLLLWMIGFGFEAVGDWQLARFKADPANRGRVLDRGLWAWTRHPNYFGDALVWWGLTVPVMAAGAPWVIISPLLMTWLLRRFSGVPLLEKGLHQTRPGYDQYVERTSPFFPRPPRRRQ